ncbi:hypothetical protein [Tsukamurella soli]
MIWCCVADARTIEVSLRGPQVTAPAGQWISAVLRLIPGSATSGNDFTPAATVRSWRAVPTRRSSTTTDRSPKYRSGSRSERGRMVGFPGFGAVPPRF